MATERIYLSPPDVGISEISRVTAALESGWVAPAGPDLTGFEDDICSLTTSKAAVALSSGTAGIQLGLMALGVRAGDAVICPTLTFGATAFAIVHAGAVPVFVDSEDSSWNLDPAMLTELLAGMARDQRLPAAIVTVDLFGRTCDYDAILDAAARYEVPVLVDSAEALGATYNGKPAGSMGNAAVFSFNGNKIMTTSGGGMLVSNDSALVEKVRHWSTQSREDYPWYEHEEIGYNYRMSNILAALGRAQLDRLPAMIEKRRQITSWYTEFLGADESIAIIQDPPWGRSNCWLTTTRFDKAMDVDAPTRVREALEAANIEARPVWKPMHQQPVFEAAEAHITGIADRIFSEGMCLPSGVALQRDDIDRISTIILDTVRQ
jgi:dTDP-4-amino-4,6-dideoxygalactose transaminase